MTRPICLRCGSPLHRCADPLRPRGEILGCLQRGCGYTLKAEQFVYSTTGEYREVLPVGVKREGAVRA